MRLIISFTAAVLFSSVCLGRPDTTLPCLLYDDSGLPIAMSEAQSILPVKDGELTTWTGTDDISMVQVGSLVAAMYETMTGGDSDQDGLFETYMYIKDTLGGWSFTYRIYENDGQNVYNQAFQADQGLIPYAFGDPDGDDLPDVIGQWSYWVYAFESPASEQLATQMVWQSPQMSNVTGYTAVGDLDQDGLGEIIHTQNSFGSDNRLIIYETAGDNQYQEIINEWVSNNSLGTKAVADFDGDGIWEVAFSSGGGDVYVFESTGNNTVQMTYHGDMHTYNAYACSYADDMDENGFPEFVCGGSSSGEGWITQIYEAVGNDRFVMRQEIIIDDGYFGVPGNAAGDLDGDGIDELIIQTAQALHIYKWDGFEWVSEGTIPENFGSILHGVFSYDGNANGYDELFWLGIDGGGYWTNETIILEYEYASGAPDITVSVTPDTLPIIIPAGGGGFGFSITLSNNESTPETFDAWCMVTLPNGSQFGPILGPVSLTLAGGQTLARDRTQAVPANAPYGEYVYHAYVGGYPADIWNEDSFYFTKIAADDGSGLIDQWMNAGESFLTESNGDSQSDAEPLSIYPNPFNPAATLTYSLANATNVKLAIYDICGRLIALPVNGGRDPGLHTVTFDGSELPSGVYIYHFTAEGISLSGKMLLLK
jgi:hypothetical protein